MKLTLQHISIGVTILLILLITLGVSVVSIVSWLVIPLLLIIGFRNRNNVVPIPVIDITLFLVLVYEIANPLLIENMITALMNGLFVPATILFYFFARGVFNDNSRIILYYIFSGILLIFSFVIIVSFLFFTATIESGGFSMTDIIPLRYLYMPGNILINDWGLMQLFLLPFPLLLSIKLPQKYKIYPIIITFIGLYSLVLTFSRGTYIATTIFLLTLTIFSIVRKIKISTPVFIRASIILALFILLLIPIRHPVVQTLSMNSTHSQSKSLSGRFDQWKRCGEILTDNELFGIGSGSYKIANKIISNRDQIPYTKKVTNSYLQVFIEKGIVGSVLYTILAIAILYTLISKLRRQKNDDELLIIVTSLLIAVAVKEFTFSTLFDLPKTFFLFIIWSLLSDDKIFRKAQIKGYLPLSLLILLIPLYYLSFIRYSQVNNAYQINQKAVIASFEKNTFKLKLILSDIDPVRIKSPVILSNMALVNINDSDTIGYNSFAKGITVMTNNGNKLHNCISLLEQYVRLAPNEPTFLLNLGWL